MKSFLKKLLNEIVYLWLFAVKLVKNTVRFFSVKERFIGLLIIGILILGWIVIKVDRYYADTKVVPAYGGTLTEGVLGLPLGFNPVIDNNDAQKDVSSLIYPTLFKYDLDGSLKNDIVDNFSISSDHLTYTFNLKTNIYWQDGNPITADDVIYTLNEIENPKVNSPLKSLFSGVKVNKISDSSFSLTLSQPYEPFLSNLTFGIAPEHIWFSNASNNNLADSPFYSYPVGAGPYILNSVSKDEKGGIESVVLKRNDNYWGNKPYIDKIVFYFYSSSDELKQALSDHGIMATIYLNPGDIPNSSAFDEYDFEMPRYFALFFNQSSLPGVLDDISARKALAESIDKNSIINSIFNGQAKNVYSPVPSGLFGYNPGAASYPFSLDAAKQTLASGGWSLVDGIYQKNTGASTVSLSFTLTTANNPMLEKAANAIVSDWNKLGAKVNVNFASSSAIDSSVIPNRSYQALIYGEALSIDPDPYSFWSSTQSSASGLNISNYKNSDVDKWLNDARQNFSPDKRAQDLVNFQNTLTSDIPAIFLYNPDLIYVVSSDVKGISGGLITDPSSRFDDISNWYINTKRQ